LGSCLTGSLDVDEEPNENPVPLEVAGLDSVLEEPKENPVPDLFSVCEEVEVEPPAPNWKPEEEEDAGSLFLVSCAPNEKPEAPVEEGSVLILGVEPNWKEPLLAASVLVVDSELAGVDCPKLNEPNVEPLLEEVASVFVAPDSEGLDSSEDLACPNWNEPKEVPALLAEVDSFLEVSEESPLVPVEREKPPVDLDASELLPKLKPLDVEEELESSFLVVLSVALPKEKPPTDAVESLEGWVVEPKEKPLSFGAVSPSDFFSLSLATVDSVVDGGFSGVELPKPKEVDCTFSSGLSPP